MDGLVCSGLERFASLDNWIWRFFCLGRGLLVFPAIQRIEERKKEVDRYWIFGFWFFQVSWIKLTVDLSVGLDWD